MPDTAGLGELWIRASRMCERCTVCIATTAHPPGWEVIVQRKTDGTATVSGNGEHLLDAFSVAMHRAEARGF